MTRKQRTQRRTLLGKSTLTNGAKRMMMMMMTMTMTMMMMSTMLPLLLLQKRRERRSNGKKLPRGVSGPDVPGPRRVHRAVANTNVITVREAVECGSSFFGKLIHGRTKKPTEKLCCDERAAATARWERGAKWAEDGNEDACFNRCPKNSRCNAKHGSCECDVGYVARDAPKDEDEDDDAAARMRCYPVREDQTEDLPIGSEDVPEIEDPMLEKERMIEKEKERREKLALAKKKKIAEAKKLEKMKREQRESGD